jgi:hypothetical protein
MKRSKSQAFPARSKLSCVCLTVLVSVALATPVAAWDNFGHMAVAYVAYQNLTSAAKQRANDLIKLNPKHDEWAGWVPATAKPATKDLMIFMLAATWADEIKGDPSYIQDGDDQGNRPSNSPDPAANKGYQDNLMHKYWHFIDKPITTDSTPPPPIPTPNAQERIALFRGVLASGADDSLKSYDLVWLLHLVGDVHQPLHCATRVSSTDPKGDNGGNSVKLSCSGCPRELHFFWDDVFGNGKTAQAVIKPAMKAAKRLPAPDPTAAAKSIETDWIDESFEAAQQNVYISPVSAGHGPFALTSSYKAQAKKLAKKRIALAGVRLANLINNELK